MVIQKVAVSVMVSQTTLKRTEKMLLHAVFHWNIKNCKILQYTISKKKNCWFFLISKQRSNRKQISTHNMKVPNYESYYHWLYIVSHFHQEAVLKWDFDNYLFKIWYRYQVREGKAKWTNDKFITLNAIMLCLTKSVDIVNKHNL